MITGDQFVNCSAVWVVFEGDEVADEIEKASFLEHTTNKSLQFERSGRRIKLAFNRAPDFEPFLIRADRPDSRFESIGDNRHFVVVHQRRNLLLVGLDLIVSGGEPFVGVFRNLQLDDSKRQSVQEHDDVRPTIVLAFDDCELVHRQPVVRLGSVEIDQPDMIACDGSIGTPILDGNSIAQHAMKRAIVADEGRRVVP